MADQSDSWLAWLAASAPWACGAVIVITLGALMAPAVGERLGFGAARPEVYAAGSAVDLDAAFYRDSARTLVIFARSTCAACQRARANLANLVSLAGKASVDVRLVAGPGTLEHEATFARELGLAASDIVEADIGRLRLRIVPTVLLIDRAGRVEVGVEGVRPGGFAGLAEALRRPTGAASSSPR